VVDPTLVPPAPGAVSVGIVDELVDPTLPDVGPQTRYLNNDGQPPKGPHGTEVASAVAAAAGNGGVMGIFPGAPLVSYAVGEDLTCSDIARGVDAVRAAGVGVINISLVSSLPCATLYRVVEQAIGAGVVITAAAGNDFQEGNPVEYPAAFPHVLSVASVAPDLSSSGFSNANAAVDVSAPGEQVPLAIPLAFDTEDGAQDGVTTAAGTSFAAPIVAGAAAWLRTARPDLTGGQLADVLRYSATDIDDEGWDSDTGWGLVNMKAALTHAAPAEDPLEPNDDMALVDGNFFTEPDPPIFTGFQTRRISATVDYAEDPDDVYRFRLPPRSALRATVTPFYGDPNLAAYDRTAKSLRAHALQRSSHRRGRESVVVSNRTRSARTGFVVVSSSDSRDTIDAGYRLTVSRAPFRR
jgi:subtilisin family serine protease